MDIEIRKRGSEGCGDGEEDRGGGRQTSMMGEDGDRDKGCWEWEQR